LEAATEQRLVNTYGIIPIFAWRDIENPQRTSDIFIRHILNRRTFKELINIEAHQEQQFNIYEAFTYFDHYWPPSEGKPNTMMELRSERL
jgi:hypothetical protein